MGEDGKRSTPAEGGSDEVIYEESPEYGIGFKLFVYPLILLYLVVFAGALAFGIYRIAVPFGFGVILLVGTFAAFGRMTVRIERDYLLFGFRVAKKRIPHSSITTCEPYDVQFSNYYGYGVRSGRDGTKGYISRNGPGVRITVEGEKRPFVLSSGNPEMVCKIVRKMAGIKQ